MKRNEIAGKKAPGPKWFVKPLPHLAAAKVAAVRDLVTRIDILTLFSMTFRKSTVLYLQLLREAAQKWMLDLARVIISLALADLISIHVICLVLPCDTAEHKETACANS